MNGATYLAGADALAGIFCGSTSFSSCGSSSFSNPLGGHGVGSGSHAMMIGYSHGGGLAAYSNFRYSTIVSKAVAMDYTPYHNPGSGEYIQNLVGAVSSGFALSIYYSCHSDWYWLEQITFGATTFQLEAGIPVNTYTTSTSYSFNNADYSTWTWTGADGRYLRLRITGLASGYANVLPNTCSCGSGSGYPAVVLGCTLNSQQCGPSPSVDSCDSSISGISHSQMPSKVDIVEEITEWVTPPPTPPPPPSPTWNGMTCHDMETPPYCCPSGTRCMYPRFPYVQIVNGFEVMVKPDDMTVKPPKYCLTKGDRPVAPVAMSTHYWAKHDVCPQEFEYREAMEKAAMQTPPPPTKEAESALRKYMDKLLVAEEEAGMHRTKSRSDKVDPRRFIEPGRFKR